MFRSFLYFLCEGEMFTSYRYNKLTIKCSQLVSVLLQGFTLVAKCWLVVDVGLYTCEYDKDVWLYTSNGHCCLEKTGINPKSVNFVVSERLCVCITDHFLREAQLQTISSVLRWVFVSNSCEYAFTKQVWWTTAIVFTCFSWCDNIVHRDCRCNIVVLKVW